MTSYKNTARRGAVLIPAISAVKRALLLLWAFAVTWLYWRDIHTAFVDCQQFLPLTDAPCFFSAIFLSAFALVMLTPSIALYMNSRILPTLLLAIFAFVVMLAAQNTAIETLSDIRTFGYQKFVILFLLWSALLLIFETTILLFQESAKRISWIFMVATCAFSIAFIFYGRGSAEHVGALLGGLLQDISWQALWLSQLVQVWVYALMIVGVAVLVTIAVQWVKWGNINYASMKKVTRHMALLFVISIIPLLSVPPGLWVSWRDVEHAKTFINRLVPKLQDFAHANDGAFPPTLLHSVMASGTKQPLLLDRFDFLAYETRGAYYVSRPEKYCFLIHNPGGRNFGYYSMTSERGWKFFPYDGRSLEEIYTELCDDPLGFQERIMRHLGLVTDPHDPEKILEPSQLFRMQWKAPDVKKFPEFLPTPEQKEQFMRENFPYLYERGKRK